MSFRLDEKLIGEIADELDMGMECYYHIPTGSYESHPDTDHPDFDPQWWQEPLDKIAADRDSYLQVYGMGSHESFQVMEDFAEALPDGKFKIILLDRLERPKPFRNFRDAVDESEYRDDWFAFKKKAYMNWVKKQLEEELSERSHFQNKMNSGGAIGDIITNHTEQLENDFEQLENEEEADLGEDIYRKRLITTYQNLLDFKNELFTDALNLAMAGELKEVDSAFEEGDAFTFTIEHLEDSKDVNLQKLVELIKQLDIVMGTLANVNAIQEDELD